MRNPYTRRRNKAIFIFLYLLFSVYFINYPFHFIEIPKFISALDTWIIFIGGVLLVIGAIGLFRPRRYFY